MTKSRDPAKSVALLPRTELMQKGADPDGRLSGLFVQAIDRRDRHQAHGESQSFVFLHGLGGTHGYWTAAEGKSHLPPGSSLVDLLGFGRSPRPMTRYTLESHLAALEPVLESEAPSVLVGHSLGAALALAYAARHPNDVTALVLISLPSYEGTRGAFRWLRRRPRGWFLTNMVLAALACVATRRLLGPALPMLIRDVPREVARDLVEHNFMSSTTSLWNVLYRRDVTLDFDALPENLRVVFIHGTEDATAPIDTIRALVKRRPSSRLVELAGVDHHPWLRLPSQVGAVITSAGTHRPRPPMARPAIVDSLTPSRVHRSRVAM